jgi:hypothetical protein
MSIATLDKRKAKEVAANASLLSRLEDLWLENRSLRKMSAEEGLVSEVHDDAPEGKYCGYLIHVAVEPSWLCAGFR